MTAGSMTNMRMPVINACAAARQPTCTSRAVKLATSHPGRKHAVSTSASPHSQPSPELYERRQARHDDNVDPQRREQREREIPAAEQQKQHRPPPHRPTEQHVEGKPEQQAAAGVELPPTHAQCQRVRPARGSSGSTGSAMNTPASRRLPGRATRMAAPAIRNGIEQDRCPLLRDAKFQELRHGRSAPRRRGGPRTSAACRSTSRDRTCDETTGAR